MPASPAPDAAPDAAPGAAPPSDATAVERRRPDAPGVERRGLLRAPSGRALGLLLGAGVLVVVTLASLAYGAQPLPFAESWRAFTAYDGSEAHLIVRGLRLPRTVIGLAVGAALGLAGAVMQGVTRNPLAEPGILGVSAGAATAVVVAIAYLGVVGSVGIACAAMVGALLASLLVYALGSRGRGGATPVKLALAGAAATWFLHAITTTVIFGSVETLDQYRFWRVGSLAEGDLSLLAGVAPLLAVGAVLALASTRGLNALSLGDDVARSLGQRLGVTRGLGAGAIVLLVGAATSVAGPITFVGLVIPHVARMLTGPDYRWVLPYSAVLGPVLLLGADVVGRLVVRPAELQVGVVTALVGAPFFIALVRRRALAEL